MIQLADLRQKRDHDCGPTAVKILLRAIRKRPRMDAMAHLATSPIDGTDPRAIETCLRAHQLHVASGSIRWEELQHITQSIPVLALVTKEKIGHWVVVGGLDQNIVHYQCPSEGPCRSGKRTWLKSWRDVDRLGAVYHQWIIYAWKSFSR